MTDVLFDENEDWDKRVLCSDESCIGTISPDGKCKECGKVYNGTLPQEYRTESVYAVTIVEQKTVSSAETGDESDDDWDKRILCRDEACIGVIGNDGKCKACGKPL